MPDAVRKEKRQSMILDGVYGQYRSANTAVSTDFLSCICIAQQSVIKYNESSQFLTILSGDNFRNILMPIQLPITENDIEDYPQHYNHRQTLRGAYVALKSWLAFLIDFAITLWVPLSKVLLKVNTRLSKIFLLRVPFLHLLNILFFIYWLARFVPNYSRLYAKNRLTTTLISNQLLFGLADSLAQTITAVFTRRPSQLQLDAAAFVQNGSNTTPATATSHNLYTDDPEDEFRIFVDYQEGEDNEVGDNASIISENNQPLAPHFPIFDYYRLLGFMLWGFIISFFQLTWYIILNGLYVDDPKFITVLERVLADQLCYSPISLAAFFYYSTVILEHGDKRTFEKKIKKVYLSTLAANYSVWPAVQFINFLFMPKQFQVPFSSSVGVLWNCFLSIRNAQSQST